MRHLIDITDLSVQEVDELIATAEDIIQDPAKYAEVCRHKKLATLFFEPSTRTRLSFEAAMLDLGGSTLGFSEAQSSSPLSHRQYHRTERPALCGDRKPGGRHARSGHPLYDPRTAGAVL